MNLFNKSTTVQHDCLTTVYMCIHPINNPVYTKCVMCCGNLVSLFKAKLITVKLHPINSVKNPCGHKPHATLTWTWAWTEKNKQTEFTSQVTVRWVLVSPQNLTPLQCLPLYWTTPTVMYRNWKQARRQGSPWIIHHERRGSLVPILRTSLHKEEKIFAPHVEK